MKRQIVVDTSALCALIDRNDRNHSVVESFLRENAPQITLLVTDYVLDETLTWVKSRFGVEAALKMGRRLRASDFCQFVKLTTNDEKATWQVFTKYSDKDWSYTDCSCLALMQLMDVHEALSTDHHFDQMGIIRRP